MATPTHGASTQGGKPTPERIFNTLAGFQISQALKAAIQLDIFTKIGEGTNEVSTLAKSIGASERGTRILCDYMTVHGFLTKENGRYGLTQESGLFLNKKSPAYFGSVANFIVSEAHAASFGALAEAVRKGGCALAMGDNTKPKDEFWVPTAEFVAVLIGAAEGKPCKVLDIAAGHGMYGITVARRNPKAEIVALDWPAVLQVAQENAKKFAVSDRHSVRPGSAFETDFGDGYDYVLLTNILHHFDEPTCEKLLRRVHAALKPGGKAIIVEFVPNEDRVSPPMAAGFSLVMLANTDAGDAYTFSQYERMTRNTGYARASLHPVPEMPQQVVVAEK
jgi:SAM-dependent methyltransferase